MFKGRSHSAELAKSLATDSITANVMVADTDLTILYLNEALAGLLKQAEADIRKDLPRFSVASLVGSNIDVFHKKPEYQRRMLEQLKAQHRATITVGGSISITNVVPGGGVQPAGTVVHILGLGFQPAKRARVDDAVAVARIFAAVGVRRFRKAPSARILGSHGPGCESAIRFDGRNLRQNFRGQPPDQDFGVSSSSPRSAWSAIGGFG